MQSKQKIVNRVVIHPGFRDKATLIAKITNNSKGEKQGRRVERDVERDP